MEVRFNNHILTYPTTRLATWLWNHHIASRFCIMYWKRINSDFIGVYKRTPVYKSRHLESK